MSETRNQAHNYKSNRTRPRPETPGLIIFFRIQAISMMKFKKNDGFDILFLQIDLR